jgi:hypothetical protein
MTKAGSKSSEGDPAMRHAVEPFIIFATIAILGASCAPNKGQPPTEPPPPHSSYWVDLLAGWRVRVVTPITHSDSFLVKNEPVPAASRPSGRPLPRRPAPGAAAVNLKTSKDLIGYEVSRYSVKPRRGGGVRVFFRSATINVGGRKTTRPRPVLPLFRLPRNDRFVRILHFAWGTHGDHNAAILAASGRKRLDALTRDVAFHASACVSGQESFCSWVPAGVAVIPERKKNRGNNGQWTPAY